MIFRYARIVRASTSLGALALALVALPSVAAAQSPSPRVVTRVPRGTLRTTLPANFERSIPLPQLRPVRPPPAPVASATSVSLQVSLEIRESSPGTPVRVERFTLPLTDHNQSKIRSRIGDTEYTIGVHRDGPDPDSPLEFDLDKSQRGPGTRSEAAVHASVRIKARQRAVIARMDRSDGSRTEVIAELK